LIRNIRYFIPALAILAFSFIQGCKKEYNIPALNTTDVNNITYTSATSGGEITDDGGAPVTSRGVCWSTSPGPDTGDNHTKDGTGSGLFTSKLDGLAAGTTYYLRAYASNSAGVGYGNEISFTTQALSIPELTTSEVTDITFTSASSGGNITNEGGSEVIARGVCWSITEDPTIADSITIDGTGTGSFVSELRELSPGTNYYVRAYATNSTGTGYGNQVNFTTAAIAIPSLTTAGVTEITESTATSGGNITDDGGSKVTVRGICWNTSQNPTIASSHTTDGEGTGSFISRMTGLAENTTYYIRAYATNNAGTGYGNQIEFTTSRIEPWMRLPYFALPSDGLSLMVGQEVTIYGDALINVPIRNNLQVIYTCDIGTVEGNNLVISPASGNIGDHTLTMTFTNNGVLLTTQTITFTVYDKSGAGNKKILLIGDSTMPPDVQQEKIVSILNNSDLTFLGTIGSSYKNEGYPGASWNGFLTGTHGKFYSSGALNIPAYFTDYSIETPDYVYIRLGINDTFPYCRDGTGPITDAAITSIITRAGTLIDAFLDYDPSLKVILGIPTISENSGAGWENNYSEDYDQDLYIQQIHRYWESFVKIFANGNYDARVDCSYDAIFLDRDNGYPKENGVHNNGVHPDQSGFEQLATGMAAVFNRLLNSD
jgi:hypothetical protein